MWAKSWKGRSDGVDESCGLGLGFELGLGLELRLELGLESCDCESLGESGGNLHKRCLNRSEGLNRLIV